jgi:hypothetical protein
VREREFFSSAYSGAGYWLQVGNIPPYYRGSMSSFAQREGLFGVVKYIQLHAFSVLEIHGKYDAFLSFVPTETNPEKSVFGINSRSVDLNFYVIGREVRGGPYLFDISVFRLF